MKGIVVFVTFVAVLAVLWRTTTGKPLEEAWLAEIKDEIANSKLR